MLTPETLRQQIRDLAQKGLDIAENKSMNNPAKIASLDKIDSQLKSLRDELTAAEYVTAKNRAWGVNTWGNSAGGDYPNLSSQPTIGAAPSINMPEADLKEMFAAAKRHQNYQFELKGNSPDLAGFLPPTLVPGILGPIHEPTRIASYLPTATMPGPTIEYLQHLSTTGAAATVAPAGLKPELTFNDANIVLHASKIAAQIGLTDESLQDFPGYVSYVSGELIRLYIDQENVQLLLGDGTGTNMLGLLNTSGILVRPVATDTGIDALEKAALDMRNGSSYAVPDLFVLNPTNWSALRRSKDGQGRYLLSADPTAAEASTLWGSPVVVTSTMPVGTGLAINSQLAAQVWVRSGLLVDSSNSSGDDFIRNLTRMRVQSRLGIAVPRPSAVVKVTGLPS